MARSKSLAVAATPNFHLFIIIIKYSLHFQTLIRLIEQKVYLGLVAMSPICFSVQQNQNDFDSKQNKTLVKRRPSIKSHWRWNWVLVMKMKLNLKKNVSRLYPVSFRRIICEDEVKRNWQRWDERNETWKQIRKCCSYLSFKKLLLTFFTIFKFGICLPLK
jgi:hypothetical protein